MIQDSDLNSLLSTVITKLDNKEMPITIKVASFDKLSRNISLEISLPDTVTPGDAILLLKLINKDGSLKPISQTKVSILPSTLARSIVTKELIGKPSVTGSKLIKLPQKKGLDTKKKEYLLILSGMNFLKRTVNVNNKLAVSPIKYQPFSLITFTDRSGLIVQKMRVRRSRNDVKRSKMEVYLLYDENLIKDKKDIRFFTVSTIVGQATGTVDLKSAEKLSPAKIRHLLDLQD